MTTTIFKSERKAKIYEIRSSKNQGIYLKDELIRTVKTDNINEIINGLQYEVKSIEIKAN